MDELSAFFNVWDREAEQTVKLLRALPADKYDYRPYPESRSIGEMAWHLAELDGYVADGIASGKMDFQGKLPGFERPRTIAELAPGYARVHAEAKAKLGKLTAADMDRTMPFFDGRMMPISQILWSAMLYHAIHHRGQLSLMCRLAGGVSPGLYGPNREEVADRKAKAAQQV